MAAVLSLPVVVQLLHRPIIILQCVCVLAGGVGALGGRFSVTSGGGSWRLAAFVPLCDGGSRSGLPGGGFLGCGVGGASSGVPLFRSSVLWQVAADWSELLLCWRQRPVTCSGREVSSLAFWFEDAAAAVGLLASRRVDRARVSPDDGRRRALVQGRQSLGRGPSRWAISDAFISSIRVSAYFDSSQSLVAMELRRSWGRRRAADGVRRVAGDIGLRRIRDAEVPRGLLVIILFSWDLSAKQLSSVSFLNVSVFVRVHVLYPYL
ncbi:uncharacterized protein LOC120656375 [Panicum virgatum]|uniref:uncharacterized protein LOC120656375 n=1 Tax=Panicum virgatum TaxID=38727 RepID=UPI0019D67897|nr:uncharacterized protein LOC120656375 [Panicum virgatum]